MAIAIAEIGQHRTGLQPDIVGKGLPTYGREELAARSRGHRSLDAMSPG